MSAIPAPSIAGTKVTSCPLLKTNKGIASMTAFLVSSRIAFTQIDQKRSLPVWPDSHLPPGKIAITGRRFMPLMRNRQRCHAAFVGLP